MPIGPIHYQSDSGQPPSGQPQPSYRCPCLHEGHDHADYRCSVCLNFIIEQSQLRERHGQPQQEPTLHPIHPAYGPCDGFGPDGNCSMCIEVVDQYRNERYALLEQLHGKQERQAGGHVGKRVVIVRAEGIPFSGSITMRDPHPEHVGKLGRVIAEGDLSVQIRLDDGTLLYGSQCWWVEVVEQGVADAAAARGQ